MKRSHLILGGLAASAAAGLSLFLRQRAGKKSVRAAAQSSESSQTAQVDASSGPDFFAFPADFAWGAATSSYQVEGGIRNDWSAAGLDAGTAVDHFSQYAGDFRQAQAMGHNAHRLSLEWARFEPAPGQWNEKALAHYRKVLQELKACGLTPFVTLWHFTQPLWFVERGGWLNPENIQAYLDYVRYVVSALKDEAVFWITLNEPLVYAFQAYDSGRWPPFGHDRAQALQVARNLLLAHVRAYWLIHELHPQAQVGLVKNMTVMDPLYKWHPASRFICQIQDRLFNEVLWQSFVDGYLDLRLPGIKPVQIAASERLQGALDFMGVNYYTRFLIDPGGRMITRPGAPLTDIGWEIYPQGLYRVLQQAAPRAKALGIPIYITENGLADATESWRQAYLVEHLQVLWQAIQEGVPVKGYFHWSLLDNFEWADGYGYQFGLMDAERKWRSTAHLYQELIRQNGISAEQLHKHRL